MALPLTSRSALGYISPSPSAGRPAPSNTRPSSSRDSRSFIGSPVKLVWTLSMATPSVPSNTSRTAFSPSMAMTRPVRRVPSARYSSAISS